MSVGICVNNKEINLKIFKLKCAYVLIYIDENLFKEIFGHTFVTVPIAKNILAPLGITAAASALDAGIQ